MILGRGTSKPKARPWVKASDQISGPPKANFAWATAPRVQMLIYDDRIEVGDWTIPFDAVTQAQMWESPPPFSARLLEIETDARTIQISFTPGTDVTRHLPFQIARLPAPQWLSQARGVLYAVAGGTLALALLVGYLRYF